MLRFRNWRHQRYWVARSSVVIRCTMKICIKYINLLSPCSTFSYASLQTKSMSLNDIYVHMYVPNCLMVVHCLAGISYFYGSLNFITSSENSSLLSLWYTYSKCSVYDSPLYWRWHQLKQAMQKIRYTHLAIFHKYSKISRLSHPYLLITSLVSNHRLFFFLTTMKKFYDLSSQK